MLQFEHCLIGRAHGLIKFHGIGRVIQGNTVHTRNQVTLFETQAGKLFHVLPRRNPIATQLAILTHRGNPHHLRQ